MHLVKDCQVLYPEEKSIDDHKKVNPVLDPVAESTTPIVGLAKPAPADPAEPVVNR